MAKKNKTGKSPALATKQPLRTTVRVAQGGRIVIPREVRQRLGVQVGTHLLMEADEDRATLMTARAMRRRAQEIVRKYIPPGISLSEELMAERKLEAERE